MKPKPLIIGYTESYHIADLKDVHPSHRVAVIEVPDLLDYISDVAEEGNLEGEKGFSASIFLSDLIKELRKANNPDKGVYDHIIKELIKKNKEYLAKK